MNDGACASMFPVWEYGYSLPRPPMLVLGVAIVIPMRAWRVVVEVMVDLSLVRNFDSG